jgi:hypothetical protein
MSSRTILSRVALGSALVSTADAPAAIVVFDITPDVTLNLASYTFDGFGIVSLDLAAGTFVSAARTIEPRDDVSNSDILTLGGYYGDFWIHSNPGAALVAVDGANGSTFLSHGASIGWYTVDTPQFGSLPQLTTIGPGASAESAYLGLLLDSPRLFGWLEFSYNYPEGGEPTLTLTRFAFNDVPNESILAGQTAAVPEASTLGLVGGLFGLVALAHARRRQQKKAAASEKFLSLAAGEKLN